MESNTNISKASAGVKSSETDQLHKGHRDRVKDRFLAEGISKFRDEDILELILFYSVPRKDTTVLAESLIRSFGSLSSLLDAEINELSAYGLSKNTIVLIKMLPQLCVKYYKEKYVNEEGDIVTLENAHNFILPFFIDAENERLCLLLSDKKGKMLYCDIISEGSFSASELDSRRIMHLILQTGAEYAYLAHNHPSGIALPSTSDVNATSHLCKQLQAIDAVLADHLIVANQEYFSMAQSGMYRSIFPPQQEN